METYIGVDQFALAVEMTFHKLPLVYYTVIHFKFAETVIPPLLVLSFVFIFKPGRHRLSYIYRKPERT